MLVGACAVPISYQATCSPMHEQLANNKFNNLIQ